MSCTPNLAGFQWFVANVMAIDTTNCDPNSATVAFSYNVALGIVNPLLAMVCIPNQQNSPYVRSQYDLAVYNLAADRLVNFYVDAPTSTVFQKRPDGTQFTFFEYLRFRWGIGNWHAGVVTSVSDVSTSTGIEAIEAAKMFTLSDLQNLKTPYGRQYLAIAQSYGTLWGLT
jgi:hypothetical protein